VALHEYWKYLASIAPHIVLAPMAPCRFNLSKSAIRVFDAWALSAAVIASDWGEYGAKVEHGRTGYKVRPNEKWTSEIRDLVLDRDRRHFFAEAGRKQLETYWSWQQSYAGREQWKTAIKAILAQAAARRF
jgi:glycosyltransferase involved in cell wall biosynthesis